MDNHAEQSEEKEAFPVGSMDADEHGVGQNDCEQLDQQTMEELRLEILKRNESIRAREKAQRDGLKLESHASLK